MTGGPAPGPTAPDPAPRPGSILRLLTGLVLLVTGLGLAVFGFATLIRILNSGGYGTPAMRDALVILGAAGAALAGAIATLIWDIAKRYER